MYTLYDNYNDPYTCTYCINKSNIIQIDMFSKQNSKLQQPHTSVIVNQFCMRHMPVKNTNRETSKSLSACISSILMYSTIMRTLTTFFFIFLNKDTALQ